MHGLLAPFTFNTQVLTEIWVTARLAYTKAGLFDPSLLFDGSLLLSNIGLTHTAIFSVHGSMGPANSRIQAKLESWWLPTLEPPKCRLRLGWRPPPEALIKQALLSGVKNLYMPVHLLGWR